MAIRAEAGCVAEGDFRPTFRCNSAQTRPMRPNSHDTFRHVYRLGTASLLIFPLIWTVVPGICVPVTPPLWQTGG